MKAGMVHLILPAVCSATLAMAQPVPATNTAPAVVGEARILGGWLLQIVWCRN